MTAGRQTLVGLIVAGAGFMELLDGSIIATALPQMSRSFHESPVSLSIGMSAYLLTLAIFIPMSGWMADRFGSKPTFLSAMAVFTTASVLCGLSNSLAAFTMARVLQGFGGAMMMPVGRLVVLRNSDKSDLVNMMQLISTPALVAPVLGPPVGGYITTFLSWRWIFFINVPIGLLGIALAAAFMTNHALGTRRPFDTPGFLLSSFGLASLLFGIDRLSRSDAGVTFELFLIGGGMLLCVLAFRHLRRTAHPLVDLSLFAIPTFAVPTLFAGAGFRVIIGATPILWPLLFQVGFGMTAFASGSLLVACAAGDLSMKLVLLRLLRRFGFRRTLIVNGLGMGLTMIGCAAFGPATPVVVFGVVLFAVGVVRSVQFGAFNALTYVDVPAEKMGSATSLASTIQQLGFGLGVAFGAMLLQAASLWTGSLAPHYDVVDFRIAFIASALIAGVAAFGFLRLSPDAGAVALRPTG